MTASFELRPESMPLCGPADTIELVGSAQGTGRHADRQEWVYVAVHRGHGLWTHVYDVVHLPGAFGEEIRLVRVLPGDRRDEARYWALTAKAGTYLRGRSGRRRRPHHTGAKMPLTRRALMLSAAAAAPVCRPDGASGVRGTGPGAHAASRRDLAFANHRRPLRRRRAGVPDLYPLRRRRWRWPMRRTWSDIEGEVLETRLDDEGHLEVEYWGTVTRFQYERMDGWPALPRLGTTTWVSDPNRTVAAFFDVLSGHFAFAAEQGIDWTALRARMRRGAPPRPRHPRSTCSTRWRDPCGNWRTVTVR